MKTSLKVLLLLTHVYVAVVAYKTGRGDSWDIAHAVVTWSQRARAAEEALYNADEQLAQCLLAQGAQIIFPRDTAEALTLAPGVRP